MKTLVKSLDAVRQEGMISISLSGAELAITINALDMYSKESSNPTLRKTAKKLADKLQGKASKT